MNSRLVSKKLVVDRSEAATLVCMKIAPPNPYLPDVTLTVSHFENLAPLIIIYDVESF
jgi:hypothetical protein